MLCGTCFCDWTHILVGLLSTSSEEMPYKPCLVEEACWTTRRTPNGSQGLQVFCKSYEALIIFLLQAPFHLDPPSPMTASAERSHEPPSLDWRRCQGVKGSFLPRIFAASERSLSRRGLQYTVHPQQGMGLRGKYIYMWFLHWCMMMILI